MPPSTSAEAQGEEGGGKGRGGGLDSEDDIGTRKGNA